MDERERLEREKVVAIARTWLGTPYHDCAMVKGAGVDCAMIIKAVFEEAGLEPPIEIPPYSPQWFLHRDKERYMEKVLERADEIKPEEATFGDLVLYRVGRCFAHGAIIVSPGWPHIIHAHKPARCVVADRGDVGPLGERERRFFTRW